ncbi:MULTISPECIES: hypothetical protein [unclassified Variovorax]|uniref:hypothetical protein n=2 Tax=Variovorax TaxID=34072 RepID=UPI00076C2FFC|nr:MULTISPECIES: hypothetical protein [unclassified Variovorax]KWT98289.1 hypothetical protein APY03_0424 [Variovorax sp. WDL1]PNG50056.1 hypothetical protein CHC06_05638 [Variovorax sp. B2]PNG50928.1 hypothetical protein CHC07_05543 [Variovorax sp. B4]VTV17083.1 hypothetical protein WDL1P1_00051 [Variovorax sp. WDL1]
MNAILWIFVALAFGLMAFVSIQDKVPEELAFLKSGGGIVEGPLPEQLKEEQLDGWTIRQQGPVLEATRRATGDMVVNGTSYDVPSFGLLCNAGAPDARIDSRMATTGVKTTPVEVDGKAAEWQKGSGLNIFPPNPVEFTRYLASKPSVSLTLSFRDLGKQTVVFDTHQLKQLLRGFPQSCR